MKHILTLLVCFVTLGNINCTNSTASDEPQWLEDLIDKFKSVPVGNPPQSIWHYNYEGRTVYYVPAQCCDQFSMLYDKSGNFMCAPDGGFSGDGDGNCSDFFIKRKNGKLIWKDTRKSEGTRDHETILIWQGDYAADGCGFFVLIENKRYKPENENVIEDKYKTDSTRVFLRFKYLNRDLEYWCGDLMHASKEKGIRIISIQSK